MKIYTKIRIDIATGKTIEEESYEYSGPLVLCMAEGANTDADPQGDATDGWEVNDWNGPTTQYDDVLTREDMELGQAMSQMSQSSGFGSFKNAFKEFASWAKTGLKAIGTIGNFAVGNIPVGVALGASTIKDLMDKNWSTDKIAGYVSQNTGVPAAEIASAITSPDFKNAIDNTSSEDLWSAAARGGVSSSDIMAGKMMGAGVPSETIGQAINMSNSGMSGKEVVRSLAASGTFLGPSAGSLASLIDTSKDIFDKNSGTHWSPDYNVNSSNPWETGTPVSGQMSNLLSTATSPDIERFNSAMTEFSKVNTDIKFIHDISELEGGLSDEEKGFLETIRTTATTNLTEAVNESTLELAQTEIAKLVDRGVLQGDIGSQTIAKIYEKSGKIVGEQSRNIESDVAKMGLQIGEQKKSNQMALWGKELEADIASANVGVDKWKSIGALETAAAGQKQEWNQNLINALTTMRGQDISLEGAKLGASTNLKIADTEMNAWKTAQDREMWSGFGKVLIDKWL